MSKLLATLAIAVSIGVVIGGLGVRADLGLKTFVPGTPIVAAEINENFSALVEALAAMQARVESECPPGTAIRAITSDGGVICVPIAGGASDAAGIQSVSAGPGVDVERSDDDVTVALDTGFTDDRYYGRADIEARFADFEARLAQNAAEHGRLDPGSRFLVNERVETQAGIIGHSGLMASCPPGHVATGGGIHVSGLVNAAEIDWVSSRPDPQYDWRWNYRVRWKSVATEPRDVFLYVVCFATL